MGSAHIPSLRGPTYAAPGFSFRSVRGSITPRRKSVTCPVLDETTMLTQSVATETAAPAAWRLPRPLGNT
jgi:hypothetical protein